MQKSDRPSPMTTHRPTRGRAPWEHLQLAPPTRQSRRAWGNASRHRSLPHHSSLFAKNGTESRSRSKTARTRRSRPSETMTTTMPWREQKCRNRRNPGSTRTLRISSSGSSGVARNSATCRRMHSRDEIRPACHASSMSRQIGSAKRSKRRSVGSSGATVIEVDENTTLHLGNRRPHKAHLGMMRR